MDVTASSLKLRANSPEGRKATSFRQFEHEAEEIERVDERLAADLAERGPEARRLQVGLGGGVLFGGGDGAAAGPGNAIGAPARNTAGKG